MGAADYDPFAEDVATPTLHSQEALLEMAELLQLVHFWRTQAERLAQDYAWIEQQNRRRYLAKKAK